MLDDDPRLPVALQRELLRAREHGADMVLAAIAAAARYTGVPVEQWRLDGQVSYPIITVPEDLQPIHPRACSMWWSHPDLLARLLAADPHRQRVLAEWAAARAVGMVGLADDGRAVAVINAFGGVQPASFEPAISLLVETNRDVDLISRNDASRHGGAAGPRMSQAWSRQLAVKALRYATAEDLTSAVIGAIDGCQLLLQDDAELTSGVDEILGSA